MRVDTSEPQITVVEDRPVFVPAFCFLFLMVGLFQLATAIVYRSWSGNDAFGIAVCLLLGGGGVLYTARRDAYRFDSRRRHLDWTRRSLVGKSRGSVSFEEIGRVVVHRGPDSDDTTYRVVFYKTDGELFPLSHGYSAGEQHHREVAEAIELALRR